MGAADFDRCRRQLRFWGLTCFARSIEYAAEHLGSPLIMVLGHKRCGGNRRR
ncbi:MAG: carbonic anhydrase [Geobacteraceae bacterium]